MLPRRPQQKKRRNRQKGLWSSSRYAAEKRQQFFFPDTILLRRRELPLSLWGGVHNHRLWLSPGSPPQPRISFDTPNTPKGLSSTLLRSNPQNYRLYMLRL